MHSCYQRVYNLFYMGTTAICVVAGIGALMALLYPLDAPVSFDVSGVEWFGRSTRGFEEASLLFNIDVDLTSLIHVNTRLYYSYIIAEWNSSGTSQHSAILWDMLIKRENPHVVLTGEPANFQLRQVGPSMRGKSVNMSFRIQQVPFVGFFRTKTLLTKTYTLPRTQVAPKK
jgi:hypothetical protein